MLFQAMIIVYCLASSVAASTGADPSVTASSVSSAVVASAVTDKSDNAAQPMTLVYHTLNGGTLDSVRQYGLLPFEMANEKGLVGCDSVLKAKLARHQEGVVYCGLCKSGSQLGYLVQVATTYVCNAGYRKAGNWLDYHKSRLPLSEYQLNVALLHHLRKQNPNQEYKLDPATGKVVEVQGTFLRVVRPDQLVVANSQKSLSGVVVLPRHADSGAGKKRKPGRFQGPPSITAYVAETGILAPEGIPASELIFLSDATSSSTPSVDNSQVTSCATQPHSCDATAKP